MEKLILASGSPRRKDLLLQAGIPYEVYVPDVDESCGLPAPQAVAELSRRKALSAASFYPGRFILAADTLVAKGGVALGKPQDREDAFRMLKLLSGGPHQVCTGVTVIAPQGEAYTGVDESHVCFASLTDTEIRAYIATGEPMDKAGAYAIQGRAALWITHLDGSPSGVIGLPLNLVWQLLKNAHYFDSKRTD